MSVEKIKFERLPFPPTNNHRLMPANGRVIMSPEHRLYKASLALALYRQGYKNADHLENKKLKVSIKYFGNSSHWLTKKKEVRKIDCDNRHKSLVDGIFSHLGCDDSYIFDLSISKVFDEEKNEIDCTVEVEAM